MAKKQKKGDAHRVIHVTAARLAVCYGIIPPALVLDRLFLPCQYAVLEWRRNDKLQKIRDMMQADAQTDIHNHTHVLSLHTHTHIPLKLNHRILKQPACNSLPVILGPLCSVFHSSLDKNDQASFVQKWQTCFSKVRIIELRFGEHNLLTERQSAGLFRGFFKWYT